MKRIAAILDTIIPQQKRPTFCSTDEEGECYRHAAQNMNINSAKESSKHMKQHLTRW